MCCPTSADHTRWSAGKPENAGSARWPVHLTLTEYVHVNVVDGLPAQLIAVHHHAEAFFAAQFEGQTLRREQDMSGQAFVFLGQIVQGADRLFGITRKCTGACGAMS